MTDTKPMTWAEHHRNHPRILGEFGAECCWNAATAAARAEIEHVCHDAHCEFDWRKTVADRDATIARLTEERDSAQKLAADRMDEITRCADCHAYMVMEDSLCDPCLEASVLRREKRSAALLAPSTVPEER